MCDKDLLVGYVYDDIIDMDRARFERHLRECAACRAEVAEMRRVRDDLAAWDAPQPAIGFRLVQDRKPSWRAWWTPAFGLAAAAVLLLAVASAITQVEVTYGSNGLTVRTGWGRVPQVIHEVRVERPEPAQPSNASVDAAALAAMDRRLAQLEASMRSTARPASMTDARAADSQIMRHVGDLVAQSETRQQQELALRIAQLARDVDAQRVADLMRIQQGQGRIEAMTTAEAAAHRDLASYILTSSKQQK
jgi:hypothetical protein